MDVLREKRWPSPLLVVVLGASAFFLAGCNEKTLIGTTPEKDKRVADEKAEKRERNTSRNPQIVKSCTWILKKGNLGHADVVVTAYNPSGAKIAAAAGHKVEVIVDENGSVFNKDATRQGSFSVNISEDDPASIEEVRVDEGIPDNNYNGVDCKRG
ncbi:MAG: hypothetical protein JWL85_894 [Candidatus Saccharibacteria bacterium]|nr:hypothetical protein [Candidatus Saccharibacteria bacterium]